MSPPSQDVGERRLRRRQLRIDAGEALRDGETDMFMGSTVQVDNILDLSGIPTEAPPPSARA